MRALIVGAGAVGQVFAHHLARGGAHVAFLVKPAYADDARRGFTLYPLNTRGAPATRFTDFEVLTAPTADWDQVYITVASNALHTGTWLAELVATCARATIVTLQPGLDDHATVAAAAGAERVVAGSIGFLSYHAPLPGETRFAEPGMAYWFFPMQKSPFSGPRAADVVAALRAGGLPAKIVRDVGVEVAFPSAMLSAFVAALEAGDWSFASLRRDQARRGARAAREAMAVAAHELGVRAPLGPRMAARAFVFRAITRLAPIFAPVDMEAYMRAHFTKVGDQMHHGLREYATRGHAAAIDVSALDELVLRLAP